jgi:hypothetical protein
MREGGVVEGMGGSAELCSGGVVVEVNVRGSATVPRSVIPMPARLALPVLLVGVLALIGVAEPNRWTCGVRRRCQVLTSV